MPTFEDFTDADRAAMKDFLMNFDYFYPGSVLDTPHNDSRDMSQSNMRASPAAASQGSARAELAAPKRAR
jgi:hypothetical protein